MPEVARVFQIRLPSGCEETQCKIGATCIVEAVLHGSPVANGGCLRTRLFGCPCQHTRVEKSFCRRAGCVRFRCSHDGCKLDAEARRLFPPPGPERSEGTTICILFGNWLPHLPRPSAKWRVKFSSALFMACPQFSSLRSLLKDGHFFIEFLAVKVGHVPAETRGLQGLCRCGMIHAICARVPHVLDTVPPDLPGHGSRRQVRRRLHDTLPFLYDLAVHRSAGHFFGLELSAAPSTGRAALCAEVRPISRPDWASAWRCGQVLGPQARCRTKPLHSKSLGGIACQ